MASSLAFFVRIEDIKGVKPYNPVPLMLSNEVAESRYILMHNGNAPSNTDGCLLAGTTKGTSSVGNSVSKLKAIKEYLNNTGIDKVPAVITSRCE